LWGILALSVVLAALKGVRFFPNEYRRLRATKSSQKARLFNSFMYFHLLCIHVPLLLSLCASRAILELNIGVDVIPTVIYVVMICEISLRFEYHIAHLIDIFYRNRMLRMSRCKPFAKLQLYPEKNFYSDQPTND
jgi:hypothetical protein